MSDGDLSITSTFMSSGPAPRRQIRAYRLAIDGGEAFVLKTPLARAGREDGNDVVIPDGAVSRTHFEIRVDEHGYRIIDLSSHNGTLVDGVRTNDAWLREGSRIRVGRTTLTFESLEERAEVPASEVARFGRLVGASVQMRELYRAIELLAPSHARVLISGETGTGKGLIARELHERSERARGPFVVFDCSAVSPALIESELFGHSKGAFTGAAAAREGVVEAADGGTLFLDELGELPLELQPKLLRVIEQQEVRRVGDSETRAVDVRFLSATNRDLHREINAGAFRPDLFYRLAVTQLEAPALRERGDDLRLLIETFVQEEAPDRAAAILAALDADALRGLSKRPWRGNVRELRSYVTRALVIGLADSAAAPNRDPVGEPDIDLNLPFTPQKSAHIASFERAYLEGQLARHAGNVSAAARASGLERMHFKRLLKRSRD